MTTRKHILVDIDHTLSDAFIRDDLINGPGGWDEYHRHSINDDPVHDMAAIINALHAGGFTIVGLTARPGKWRQLTMQWLDQHGIAMDVLLMRPDDLYVPAPELKLKLANEYFERAPDHVAAIIDDRNDVVMAFAAIGITALQVFARHS